MEGLEKILFGGNIFISSTLSFISRALILLRLEQTTRTIHQNQLRWIKFSSLASGDHVIKSWDGSFFQARTANLGAPSLLVAEAIAMQNRVQIAVQVGDEFFCFRR